MQTSALATMPALTPPRSLPCKVWETKTPALVLLAISPKVAALHSLDVGSIDHALDQLTSSVNLFDLPVIDVSDMGHADS
jgi:hypothetical protein